MQSEDMLIKAYNDNVALTNRSIDLISQKIEADKEIGKEEQRIRWKSKILYSIVAVICFTVFYVCYYFAQYSIEKNYSMKMYNESTQRTIIESDGECNAENY